MCLVLGLQVLAACGSRWMGIFLGTSIRSPASAVRELTELTQMLPRDFRGQ